MRRKTTPKPDVPTKPDAPKPKPKPKRKAVKRAARKRAAAPKPKGDAPPRHLGRDGRALWFEHVTRTTDRKTLELWCASYETWLAAQADVRKNGFSLECVTEKGQSVYKVNPACAVMASTARIMMACQRKLGAAAEDEKKGDAFSKFDGM